MNRFDPPTFSSDWEHCVVDRLGRLAPPARLMGFAGLLAAELDLPIGIDKMALEFPLGINHSLAEIWARIQRVTDRATELLAEAELTLYPAAAHPVEAVYNSAHIHVGTLTDESAGIYLENALVRWVPALVALAANSPAANRMRGAYKSYRARYMALDNIKPSMWRDPRTAQQVWGSDINPKLFLVPTLEVRATDCASSRRFLAELAVFTAAFVHAQATVIEPTPPDSEMYRDYLVNRYAAARDGLQASFRWTGGYRPAVEVLEEMLDDSANALAALGASRNDLGVITAMLRKRACQADMLRPLLARYPDPRQFASIYGNMLRCWTWFEEWLDAAPPLEPLPALDEEAILGAHLAAVGEGIPAYRLRQVMALPPAAADALIEEMVVRGLVTRERTAERGMVLSRVPSPEKLSWK